jgi:hypothetical protein
MGSWQALQVLRIDFASLGHAKHIHAQESRFGAAQREWGDGRQSELALLAEFTRHDSVIALASAIAERLGGAACEKDLIAGADLGLRRDKR